MPHIAYQMTLLRRLKQVQSLHSKRRLCMLHVYPLKVWLWASSVLCSLNKHCTRWWLIPLLLFNSCVPSSKEDFACCMYTPKKSSLGSKIEVWLWTSSELCPFNKHCTTWWSPLLFHTFLPPSMSMSCPPRILWCIWPLVQNGDCQLHLPPKLSWGNIPHAGIIKGQAMTGNSLYVDFRTKGAIIRFTVL